jgi:hypothetical protein
MKIKMIKPHVGQFGEIKIKQGGLAGKVIRYKTKYSGTIRCILEKFFT